MIYQGGEKHKRTRYFGGKRDARITNLDLDKFEIAVRQYVEMVSKQINAWI